MCKFSFGAVNDVQHSSLPRRGGLGLLVLFVAAFLTITTETLPMGLLPQMSKGLGASESQVGLLVAVYAFVIMVVTLPLASWTARWPRRRLFLVIMAAFAVSNLLMALAPSFPVAIVGRVVAALVHGVLWSMMAAYATRMVTPERAGRAVATVYAGNSAALSLGVPLGTAMGNALGWRSAFVALAVVAAVITALAPALLPHAPGARSSDSSVTKAFRIPGVLAIALATTLIMLGHFTLYTYVAPYLAHAGVTEQAVSPVLFAFGVAGIAGVWCAGLLVDRRPRGALLGAVGIMVLALAALAAFGSFTCGDDRSDRGVGAGLRGPADLPAVGRAEGRGGRAGRRLRPLHHRLQPRHRRGIAGRRADPGPPGRTRAPRRGSRTRRTRLAPGPRSAHLGLPPEPAFPLGRRGRVHPRARTGPRHHRASSRGIRPVLSAASTPPGFPSLPFRKGDPAHCEAPA